MFDAQYNEHRELYAAVVVNAAGIWGQRIAEYADLSVAHVPGERLAA